MDFWQLFFLKQERLHSSACRISAPKPGMESGPPALGALSLLPHWTKSLTVFLIKPLSKYYPYTPYSYLCHYLEKGTATHSSTLVWKIPCKEEPDGLQSTGSQIDTTKHTHTCHYQSSSISTRPNNLPITPFTLMKPAGSCRCRFLNLNNVEKLFQACILCWMLLLSTLGHIQSLGPQRFPCPVQTSSIPIFVRIKPKTCPIGPFLTCDISTFPNISHNALLQPH